MESNWNYDPDLYFGIQENKFNVPHWLCLTEKVNRLTKQITLVDGHGRLFDPPSRSTAWRVGFDTPKDYNVRKLKF